VNRKFFTKKTDFRNVTDKQVNQVKNLLHNKPVRKFNYLTTNQVIEKNWTKYLNLNV
jgi:IS30 family transposase